MKLTHCIIAVAFLTSQVGCIAWSDSMSLGVAPVVLREKCNFAVRVVVDEWPTDSSSKDYQQMHTHLNEITRDEIPCRMIESEPSPDEVGVVNFVFSSSIVNDGSLARWSESTYLPLLPLMALWAMPPIDEQITLKAIRLIDAEQIVMNEHTVRIRTQVGLLTLPAMPFLYPSSAKNRAVRQLVRMVFRDISGGLET